MKGPRACRMQPCLFFLPLAHDDDDDDEVVYISRDWGV